MASHDYTFVTRWRVRGTREDVWRVLEDPSTLPQWWPSVYLDVKQIAGGTHDGVGREFDLWTRGWLPYTLRWRLRVSSSQRPAGFSIEASGDFVGTGEWTFTQDDEFVDIVYVWMIRAEKPLLKYFSFLFKPIFAANHRWAMTQGEASLRQELQRRSR